MWVLVVVPTILFVHIAAAQEVFKWKDEKGQWYFSNFPPSGVRTEKVKTGDTVPESRSQPSVPNSSQEKKAEEIEGKREEVPRPPAYGISGVDPPRLPNRRLLVFPPGDTGRPLPEWIPVESFESEEKCEGAKALQIWNSFVLDFGLLNSRCISLAEFKPSKEASVIVTFTMLGPDPGGFSTPVLSGRVFNRGLTTARSVVVKYQARGFWEAIYAEGEILTNPIDVPPITFAEYRGRIPDVGTRIVHTQADWSKD